MSDAILAAIIAGTPLTITSLAGLILSFKTKQAVNELHLIVNSRLTQLLDQTAKASKAEGVVEGKASPKIN